MKKTFKTIVIIATLLAVTLLPTASVFAKGSAQGEIDAALSKAYAAEQTWLGKQEQALAKADQTAAKVQEVIEKAAARGIDISALQSALATFNSSLAGVKSEHQNAASILSAHSGFDGSGNVTDRQAARDTVMNARRALGEAHISLTEASWALRDAVRDWRAALSQK